MACRLPLSAAIGAAVAVRLLAGFAVPAGDTDTYEFGWLAHNVVEGRGYSYFHAPDGLVDPTAVEPTGDMLPSAHMPPGYTYVVVAATELGVSDAGTVWAVRAFNLAAAAAGLVIVDRLARRLVGRGGARLAALGFALYPALVYGATQVSAANLYLPLELGLLLLLVRAAESPSGWRYAAAGLVMGLVCLLRAEAVILLPLAALWLAWAARRRPEARAVARGVAVFACVAVLAPGAWLVRTSVAFGTPVATVTTTGGMNLWMGNHEGASGSQKDTIVPREIDDEVLALTVDDDFELRRDALFRRRALDYMANDPAGTVLRDLKKAALLLVVDVHDRRNLNPAYLGSYAALAVTAVAGFARWWRRRAGDPVRWLVAGYLASCVAVPVAFFALARYRLPIEALMLVYAGGWASHRFGPDTLADMTSEQRDVAEVPA